MTGKLQTVAEMWQDYRREVVPRDAGAIQIQECRRAFYAGVSVMFTNAAYGVARDDVSEDQGVEYFEKIDAELKAYMLTVGTKWEGAKSS